MKASITTRPATIFGAAVLALLGTGFTRLRDKETRPTGCRASRSTASVPLRSGRRNRLRR